MPHHDQFQRRASAQNESAMLLDALRQGDVQDAQWLILHGVPITPAHFHALTNIPSIEAQLALAETMIDRAPALVTLLPSRVRHFTPAPDTQAMHNDPAARWKRAISDELNPEQYTKVKPFARLVRAADLRHMLHDALTPDELYTLICQVIRMEQPLLEAKAEKPEHSYTRAILNRVEQLRASACMQDDAPREYFWRVVQYRVSTNPDLMKKMAPELKEHFFPSLKHAQTHAERVQDAADRSRSSGLVV